jgi:hypothetical protein
MIPAIPAHNKEEPRLARTMHIE